MFWKNNNLSRFELSGCAAGAILGKPKIWQDLKFECDLLIRELFWCRELHFGSNLLLTLCVAKEFLCSRQSQGVVWATQRLKIPPMCFMMLVWRFSSFGFCKGLNHLQAQWAWACKTLTRFELQGGVGCKCSGRTKIWADLNCRGVQGAISGNEKVETLGMCGA